MLAYGPFIGIAFPTLLAILAAWHLEVAVIVTRFLFVIGGALGLALVVYYLENAGRPDFTVEFTRRDIENVKDAETDEVKDGLFKQKRTLNIARRDDGKLLIVQPGFMNFLARYYADPAEIDETDITTEVLVQDLNGSVEKEFLADPLEDEPIYVKTPSWTFSVPLFKDQPDERLDAGEVGEEDTDGDGDDTGRVEQARAQVGSRLRAYIPPFNWDFVAKSAFSLTIGVAATSSVLGLPMLGVLIGMVPIIAMSLHAEDGEATWTPAPAMSMRALELIYHLQEDYTRAASIDDLREKFWKERIEKTQNIEDIQDEYDLTLISEFFGTEEGGNITNGEQRANTSEVKHE
jgi:hypothetical protein